MKTELLHHIQTAKNQKKKLLAVLIDPDNATPESLDKLVALAEEKADFFLVGGSLVTNGNMDVTLEAVKARSAKPCIIFPGSPSQISSKADGIFLLSLISGRNPDLLIGKHVEAAYNLKSSGLEIIPTGYILVDGGRTTTVSYISSTVPIPNDKAEIAAVTALAGEQLGLRIIYMDAGSGAATPIPASFISKVRESMDLPIVVGGGVRSAEELHAAWDAGADLVVIGNHLEKNPEMLERL